MDLPKNTFKHAIAAGQLQIGLWSMLSSPIAVDAVADSAFDWILLDTEHSPTEVPGLMHQLQALRGGTVSPIVRPAWNDSVMFKRILDIGAQTLLVPYAQNADEAAAAVQAIRYPPTGIRGVTGSGRASRYGRVKDYLKTAESELCLLVQVETGEALEELDKIAAVDGVDGVFIGPSDLSASLGHIGNPGHEDVQSAIKQAVDTLKAAGKPAGVLTPNEEEARRYIDWGFTFVAVGIDLLLVARGADALAARFKG
jgi:4-hydroxy-2-oxoheptanedioate aldolase